MNTSSNCIQFKPDVSVIIPTTCESTRAALLQRAIQSVLDQSGVTVETIVVINGARSDFELSKEIENNSRIRVIRLEEGNVSKARYEGLRQAQGRYFGFLDDDDEFLSNALRSRVDLFRENSGIDVVVTNGFEHISGNDTPLVKPGLAEDICQNPGECFIRQNWFASPASMFCAATIKTDSFDIGYKYFEWTYLFFLLLSAGKRFHYDESLTYRKYEDNPLSISKSREYASALPEFLLSLQKLTLHPIIKKGLREKYINALNSQANFELESGNKSKAWRCHLLCVLNGGWQYLAFTRHLFTNTDRRTSDSNP